METKNRQLMTTKKTGAFTLIELLVVIAIMGILAGLLVNLAGKASDSKKKSRVQTELDQLVTVIESYKEKKGFYPPGNGTGTNPAVHQLFYELTGATLAANNNEYQTVIGAERISVADIDEFFKAGGIANSASAGSQGDVKNFFTSLKPAQHQDIDPDANDVVRVLVVPVDGPTDLDVGGRKINPWRYNVSSPTNNPDSYDLWAEILVGGKTNIIGNWKK